MITGLEDSQLVSNINGWGSLPIISAILIAVSSELLNIKDFKKPFRIFLLILAASTVMIALPLPVSPQPEIFYTILSVITVSVSGYLVFRRKDLTDIMFLIATICFGLAEVGKITMDTRIEFTVFAYTSAYMFLVLVFVAARETGGKGIASFFALERELKKTQQELEISRDKLMIAEDNFKSLVKAIADPVVIVDKKGQFLEINDKITEATGFSTEDFIGKNFMQIGFVSTKTKTVLMKNLAKRMMGIDFKPYEIEVWSKSGESLHFEINAKKIEYQNKSADLVVFHDVTERKRMEQKLEKHAEQLEEKVKERTKILRENEEKILSIFNSSPDAISVTDLKGKIIECNNANLDLFGVSTKEEILGKNSISFVAKNEHKKIRKNMKNILRDGPITNIEYTAVDKDGREFPAEFSASAIKDQSGNPTGFVGIIKDITERKRKEKELHRSETKNKAILNAIPDLMWQIDKEGVFSEFIPANDSSTSVLPEQMIGKNISEVTPKWFAQKVMQYAKKAFETNAVQIFEYQLPLQDGVNEMHDYEARLVVGGDNEILSIVRDITERKRMENELRHYSEQLEDLVDERTKALQASQELLVKSERLAAIGQAATMVGHDLRNPLQAIENGVYYINTELENVPASPRITETLQAIHKSVDYADNIVKDLQSFASKREPVLRETDINDLVKESFSHVKTPENVKKTIELEEFPKIDVDRDMIERVFVNLATNGIQAMEKTGGTLKVTTKKLEKSIQINFQDTGIGMKEETLKKIFMPFFTTKAQGMGVGLAICKRFVELHEGNIKVESEEGKGSVFTVELPIQKNGGVKRE
jgi:PAS domain S-box-containing protein